MDPLRIISLIILVFSAILHEIAHGFVADRLGDPTARLMGRLTLDPRKHIDPFMSILLPFLLVIGGSPVVFGAAKPVPVDEFNFHEPRKDMAITALAGPITNALLAIIAAGLFHILNLFPTNQVLSMIQIFLELVAINNIVLAIFNLLPIPPLDGSKFFALLLPERDANAYLRLGSVGFMIIFFLLAFPIGGFSLSAFIDQVLIFCQNLLGL